MDSLFPQSPSRRSFANTDFPPPLLRVLRISFSAHVPRMIYLQNPVIGYLKHSISLGWVRHKRTEIVHRCSYSLRRNAFWSPLRSPRFDPKPKKGVASR